jgi:hypothetical protein
MLNDFYVVVVFFLLFLLLEFQAKSKSELHVCECLYTVTDLPILHGAAAVYPDKLSKQSCSEEMQDTLLGCQRTEISMQIKIRLIRITISAAYSPAFQAMITRSIEAELHFLI